MARAEEDASFLGSALAAYRQTHELTDETVARWLECSLSELHRLALCRLPTGQHSRFRDDLHHIAAFAPCNVDRLLELVREVAALAALRDEASDSDRGMLLAARDRDTPPKRDPE